MSTWTEVTDYIKTQLRPGVLGNTDVQKILNSVLAVVNQINAGDFTPTPDALWKATVTYAADTQPVLWQDSWLVSNVANNLGNVPISTAGVVHPTWRVIGSSAGSGIRIWEAIVYPNTLEIVFNVGNLYYLDRALVGTDPFVSVDFAVELGEEKWKVLTGSVGSSLPVDVEAALLAAEEPTGTNFYITLSYLLSQLPDQLIDEGTVTFLSSISLRVQNVAFLRGGVARVITDQTIVITDNSPTVNRVDIVYATIADTPLYTAGTEDGSQAIPTVPDAHVLIRTLFRNSSGDNTQTSPGGGGGTPNLQQVTNKGNVTSKTIQHAAAATDAQSATLAQVKSESSGASVKAKLEALSGAARLSATAIKDLPDGPTDFTASTLPVLFDIPRKYGFTTAVTGNFTCGDAGAFESSMAKVRHNDTVAPAITGPVGVTMVKDGGTYVVSVDNIIYLVCHKDDSGTVTKIAYTITQAQ